MKVSAVSATSLQPLSMVSAWPRPAISTNSVMPELRGGADRLPARAREPARPPGAPDVMERLAATIFSGLDGLTPAERTTLLDTFGVWLDSKGSAQRTAEVLFCHPNTIRHRIRRLERHTGRSTADPRALAELTLALEVTRRS
jgi:hypothetical protein